MAPDRPPDEASTRPADPHPAEVPERVGPYAILGVLGEGGMGTVFLAEQKEPVRRRVALKVIKLGMDSKAVLNRFEAERQALAMMNHDHIARVFEAGTTERGQPFFAMEHVPGLPLTEHCDKHRLPNRQRLELFMQVCAGVQHAHQKGVIHRDLKPSNVLVTADQGHAVPKIIDFGLARATDQRLIEATLFTEQGQIVGTPEYMSPEQAEMSTQDIDTRTDVYSLGVLLYELLVGHLPFARRALRDAGLLEIQRKIREDEPPRPSTRLSGLGDASEHAAEMRCTTRMALRKELRGDLDWIVMRAMEKDRNRRYETASALADDIRRHLAHEPVVAGPPGAGYRLSKLVRRYRGQVIAGALILVVLIAGVIATSIFAVIASEQSELNRAQAAKLNVSVNEFNMLSSVVHLRTAREKERDFYAWPEKIDAMQRWLDHDWARLAGSLPQLRSTIEVLRGRAQPPVGDELAKREAALRELVEPLQQRLTALQRAAAVRTGKAQVEPFALDAQAERMTAKTLNDLAWQRVAPRARRQMWGDEARGLAYARLAVQKIAAGDDSTPPQWAHNTLAWALFHNGLDDEARAAADAAVALSPDGVQRDELRAAIDDARGEPGRAAIAELTRRVADRRARAEQDWSWSFASEADDFLHDTLRQAVIDIETFGRDEVPIVREQLAWARRVERLSIDAHRSRWDAAREALRRADGTTASELYGGQLRELPPQTGLVPIGMNPQTQLWEFYHLRSAKDPTTIPAHRDDGSIEVTPDTGIVFVLVPGGTFWMGSQKTDPNRPGYDPFTDGDAQPVHRVTLAPYFLARHETTRAQWRRLSSGSAPSWWTRRTLEDATHPLGVYPVENVSWDAGERVLRRSHLHFATEAQWEYGCRAGTTSPWHTGATAETLHGFANVMDATAFARRPDWREGDAFADGFWTLAPVGSFRANAFGLYDMHGNVMEWARDAYGQFDLPWREGDGLRLVDAGPSPDRTIRGGSFLHPGTAARSSGRVHQAPAVRFYDNGIRAARAIER